MQYSPVDLSSVRTHHIIVHGSLLMSVCIAMGAILCEVCTIATNHAHIAGSCFGRTTVQYPPPRPEGRICPVFQTRPKSSIQITCADREHLGKNVPIVCCSVGSVQSLGWDCWCSHRASTGAMLLKALMLKTAELASGGSNVSPRPAVDRAKAGNRREP